MIFQSWYFFLVLIVFSGVFCRMQGSFYPVIYHNCDAASFSHISSFFCSVTWASFFKEKKEGLPFCHFLLTRLPCFLKRAQWVGPSARGSVHPLVLSKWVHLWAYLGFMNYSHMHAILCIPHHVSQLVIWRLLAAFTSQAMQKCLISI